MIRKISIHVSQIISTGVIPNRPEACPEAIDPHNRYRLSTSRLVVTSELPEASAEKARMK